MPSTMNEFLENALKDQETITEMKMVEMSLTNKEVDHLQHALQYCIDQQSSMGGITPKMAKVLEGILRKI